MDNNTFDQLGHRSRSAAAPRAGHPQPDKAGAKVIAYDVQFTEPRPRSGDDIALIDACAPRAARRCSRRPRSTPTARRSSAVRGAGLQPRDAGELQLRQRRRRADPPRRVRARRPQDVPDRGGARRSRAQLDLPPGNSAWIDFEGVDAERPPTSASSTSTRTGFDPADGARQGRRRRRHGARRCRTCTRPRSPASGLMSGPEIQANAITTALDGFPLHGAPRWVDIAAARRCSASLAPLAALRLRILAGARDRRRRAGGVPRRRPDRLQSRRHDLTRRLSGGRRHRSPCSPPPRIHGVTVAFEREQARDAFARFVPEAVVDEVLRSADGVAPGRRPARGHGHVQRPARLHVVRRDARAGSRHRRRSTAT